MSAVLPVLVRSGHEVSGDLAPAHRGKAGAAALLLASSRCGEGASA
jgi:hypothetical protein